MSTYIHFRDGEAVHIVDVYTGTKTVHVFIETGKVYERECTAVKRAILLHRKKMYNSTRKRRKRKRIVHTRMMPKNNCTIIKPSIVSYYEDGILVHLVVETGKKFKDIKRAINNAIRYVKFHTK